MLQRVLPRTAFEQQLPDGWFLSRLYKGSRILYYKDIKAASIPDTFNIEAEVQSVISEPPECVQAALYNDGKLKAANLSSAVQKKLVRSGLISYEFAVNCLTGIADWLSKHVPKTAEYNGQTYTSKKNRWYDQNGNCINTSVMFISIWDARVRYARGDCTLEDVARYSWSAVLECLGDDHQRFVNTVIKPKLEVNRKAWVVEAKNKRARRLERNSAWSVTEWDESEKIASDYKEEVNSTLYHHFFSSVDNHVLMFTQPCKIPAFKDMYLRVRKHEDALISRLQSISPRLSKFRWNVLLKSFEPVFAPQAFSEQKREEFFDLVHQVIIGKMSGHEAALHFTNGDWKKITRESRRYTKSMTQYVPFYTERWKKLDKAKTSFTDAVQYVKANINDLITLGYRAADKVIAAFNYDGCRFTVSSTSGAVHYTGPAGGKYLPESWVKLKPEQRRAKLNDDTEWEYQEGAIKKYRRLFSYLYNVVHKHWERATYFVQDKAVAKHKYLRLSSRFLDVLKERADKYLNQLERGYGVC